jgi:hypothetical protein
METNRLRVKTLRVKTLKRVVFIFIIIVLWSIACIQQGSAQMMPYYPYPFFDPFCCYGAFPMIAPPFYGYPAYGYPGYGFPDYGYRNASAVLPTSTLLTALLAPTTTITAAPIIGVATAITLFTLGGTGLSATTLAILAATPVPTTVTTTPSLTATLLLLGI